MHDYRGTTLGNYRLIRLLGEGRFTHIYLGEHIFLKKRVAVKVLQHQENEEGQKNFLKEAQILASLEHPHIVRILDFGVENGMAFLIMSYAPNGTLRQRHREGSRLPLATIDRYLTQIASALQYAHEQHVIHRDVKPQNLLIGLNDEILLSDFGLATKSRSQMFQQTPNQAGTITYMAPEQLQGNAYPASDQYALGIVVYEWLCGNRPFQGMYKEIVEQQRTAMPPSLCEQVPEISSALEQVVFKALAKDPQERFANIQAFGQAFHQAYEPSLPAMKASSDACTFIPKTSQQAHVAPLISTAASLRWKRPSRSHKNLLIGFALLLLIAGSLGLFYPALLKTRANGFATATAIAEAPGIATKTAAMHAYATATSNGVMSGFDAQHTDGNPYERILNLTNVSHLVPDWTTSTGNIVSTPPIIAYNIVYVQSEKLYALDASTSKPIWATSLGLSSAPALAYGIIYVGSYDHKIYAFDALTGTLRWSAPLGNGDGSPSDPVVANGIVYISYNDHQLYAFDAVTGTLRWSIAVGSGATSDPVVANGLLYMTSDDHKLYAFNAFTGKPRWAVSIGDNNSDYFSLMIAHGIIYASGYEDSDIHAFAALTGKRLWIILMMGMDASDTSIADSIVYCSTGDGKLAAFNAATGKRLWEIILGSATLYSPVVANGVLYTGLEDGKLFALNASTGKTLWSASVGGVASHPVVANGILYVGSYDNNLYAFHLPNPIQ